MQNNYRVVLVTGASSGIGKCCAEYLSQQGCRVYGTSRRTDLTDSERRSSNTNLFQMIQMDVTEESSVKKGIDYVVLVEPGDIKTDITLHRLKTVESTRNSAYCGRFQNVVRLVESGERNGPTPEPVSKLVNRVISMNSPRLRYTVGKISQRIGVPLKKILPSHLFESLIANNFQAD